MTKAFLYVGYRLKINIDSYNERLNKEGVNEHEIYRF